MKRTGTAAIVAVFMILIMACALVSGCGAKDSPGSGSGSAETAKSRSEAPDLSAPEADTSDLSMPEASDTSELSVSEPAAETSAVSETDGEDEAEGPLPEESVQTADHMDIPVLDSPCGSLMASDGEYIYFSYRAIDEELGGLYRADPDFAHAEMIDRGSFAGLYLSDGYLYYNEGRGYDINNPEFRCLETASLSSWSISEEEYREAAAAVDHAGEFNVPEDARHAVVVNDKAYFIIYIPEEEDVSDDPKSHYELFSCERWGEWVPTGISWEYRWNGEGLISAYGDCVFYSRPCAMKEGIDWAEEGEERYLPCCYNTVTGTETVLMRNRGFNCSVYVVNAASDYLLISSSNDSACDGATAKLEKLSDPAVVYDAELLVKGAVSAEALIQQEEAEKAAEEEALKNEPYGPGTSTLYLSAPDDRSACYRLVRMDGSTEFMVLLSPGEETARSFPSGRYVLKTAEGDTWISDEEAFGDAGSYSTTDVFTFEDGAAYEISSGTRGDFYSDDAGGFTD